MQRAKVLWRIFKDFAIRPRRVLQFALTVQRDGGVELKVSGQRLSLRRISSGETNAKDVSRRFYGFERHSLTSAIFGIVSMGQKRLSLILWSSPWDEENKNVEGIS